MVVTVAGYDWNEIHLFFTENLKSAGTAVSYRLILNNNSITAIAIFWTPIQNFIQTDKFVVGFQRPDKFVVFEMSIEVEFFT